MNIDLFAKAIRFLSADMVEKAKSGHPGMPLGMADVASILFTEYLEFNPHDPDWFNRDRFILSAGHGSALLYSLLYLTGYKDLTLDELKNFRQLGSKTAGHPEYGLAPGIETTTGPLGQGLANAVGMAISEKALQARIGNKLVNHKVYTIVGDGCLMEGISQEAISIAGHLQLNNLVVLFDDNSISIDGDTSLTVSEDHTMRFKAAQWEVIAIDGHNHNEIRKALGAAQKTSKPILIKCKTKIGFGAPTKVATHHAHGSPLGGDEIKQMRVALDWDYEPFVIPSSILDFTRNVWKRNEKNYQAWIKQDLTKLNALLNWKIPLDLMPHKSSMNTASEATRVSSGKVLEKIYEHTNKLIGGSADLTGSNNTKTSHSTPITHSDFSGNYIHYGVREHGMAAVMNGIALHGAFVPYSGTFLTFSDYARPAIRLAALMKQRLIHVMTHDSIGLGEDGPTHQAVEHLAALRAIPNLYVMRPCDGIETMECWELALNLKAPTIMALSRQNVDKIRDAKEVKNLSARGAYIISDAKKLDITIFASGSEMSIAKQVAKNLGESGMGVRLISVPCMDLFLEQDAEYQMSFSCNKSLKVAIEAGVSQGWEKLIGAHGMFFGVETFGESAPYQKIYEHFGLTVENITGKIKKILVQQ